LDHQTTKEAKKDQTPISVGQLSKTNFHQEVLQGLAPTLPERQILAEPIQGN